MMLNKISPTTYNHGDDAPLATVVSPRSNSPIQQTILPVTPEQTPAIVGDDREPTVSSTEGMVLQLQEAKEDAKKTADALEDLVVGVRAVKRILEQAVRQHDADEETPTSNVETSNTSMSDDSKLVSDLSERLHGLLGSDLLALVNAADTLREHSKLAVKESSILVEDVFNAQQKAEKNKIRAKRAEKAGRLLFEENTVLKEEVKKLRGERKALVKEVKRLRQEAEETKKYDSWRLLEHHVLDSMAIHEGLLKTPTSKNNVGAEGFSSEEKEGESFDFVDVDAKNENKSPKQSRQGSDEAAGKQNEAPKSTPQVARRVSGSKFLQSKPAIVSPSMSACKSPMPSLDEVTDDSFSELSRSSKDDGTQNQTYDDKLYMPRDVSFINTKTLSQSQMASPLVSPDGSPAGVPTAEYKPICDSNILRTLAIPSAEKEGFREFFFPSPRSCVGPGLYEC